MTLVRATLEWELVSHSFLSGGLELFFMNAEFIAMLDYLERERGIKREILLEAVSNALLSASKKSVSASRELRIDINPKTGEIRALANLIVVGQGNESAGRNLGDSSPSRSSQTQKWAT